MRRWIALGGVLAVAAVYALPACRRARPRPRVNLVLLSIDALRADRMSIAREVHRLPGAAPSRSPSKEPRAPAPGATTPRLDAWARAHATVFRQVIAAAPWTLPSHASLLTGFDPLRHGTNRPHYALPRGVPTLAERLHVHGYSTAAITGGAWLDPAYGLLRGFDRIRSWSQPGRGDIEWERHAAEAAAWLETLPQPFFLFVHTYDVHDFPRAPRLARDTPDDERARLYDAAVAHVDAHLGPLLARLSAPPLRGRTAVVVTSDHGEALGERTADGGRDYGHGSLRDPVLHVPLLLSLPGDSAFCPPRARALVRSVDEQVRLIDVAPTLLELAGLQPPMPGTPVALDGVSLLPLLRGARGAVPPLALSYFSRPGHGLALREASRFKYTFDDSAFGPPETSAPAHARGGAPSSRAVVAIDHQRGTAADHNQGRRASLSAGRGRDDRRAGASDREALFDLAPDPGERHNLASGHAHVPTWRALARRLIEERTAGLALRLRAGEAPASLLLRGALLDGGTPTSSAWPGPALCRVAPDVAELQLPARGEVTLLFQPTGEPHLTMESAGVQTTLGLRHHRVPAAWSFDGRVWTAVAVARAAVAGDALAHERPRSLAPCGSQLCVTLAWQGMAHSERWTAPVAAGPDARERLRALGYVQ